MQAKNRVAWVIAVIVMLLAVLLYFYGGEKKYNWGENLQADGDDPYDLNIFFELLEENTQNANFTELTRNINIEFADLDSSKTYNYFVVRRDFYPDTNEIVALENFVRTGNNLFISANNITPLLAISLAHGSDSILNLYEAITTEELYAFVPDSISGQYEDVEYYSQKDSIHKNYQYVLEDKVWEAGFNDSVAYSKSIALIMPSNDQKITFYNIYRHDTLTRQWNGIKLPSNLSGERLATFSNGKPAFVKFKIGKGSVIIGSPPLLFTNYSLLQKDHFTFCNSLLAHVPKGDFLVDNVNRFNRDMFTPKGQLSQSPLTFILAQPALVWAWYTLLISALLFIIFRSKRKQRIIPILKPNLNTTLAYAKMLGSLQLKEKNNSTKAAEIFQHFLQHLRSRNRWHSNEITDELKNILVKLAPDLNREIQIVLYLGSKAQKRSALADQEVVNLFNFTKKIIERI